MQIIEHSRIREGQFEKSVITIGNFDGVHLGHRALLREVVKSAGRLNATSIVYTFHPHPLKILNPASRPPMLTSFDDRVSLIAAQDIDVLVWAAFDRKYADQKPEDFVCQTLVGSLGAKEIWIGPDFAFGRGRQGTRELLSSKGKDLGFKVSSIPPFMINGGVVSSTRIRNAAAVADFKTAEKLLGRPFIIHGPVIHGAGRGKGLGFPTANLLPREECLPPSGVYAARARVDGNEYFAAVNIGPNPTFNADESTVEAHLMDFCGNLYGAELELHFVAFLRGEIAFKSVDALTQQINKDVEEAKRLLSKAKR